MRETVKKQMLLSFRSSNKQCFLSILGNAKVLKQEIKTVGYKQDLLKFLRFVDVSYMRGNVVHPHLPRYKMCAITDVSVNYTPDGNYASIRRGPTSSSRIKVEFHGNKTCILRRR